MVSNLETGEPLWFGRERKKETLDEFFRTELSARQRQRIEAACVDMWEPFTASIRAMGAELPPSSTTSSTSCSTPTKPWMKCGERSSSARAARMRGLVKGKRWLLLTRWVHLNSDKRQQLNHLFSLNRKVMKAYLLKESLERLWTYHLRGRDAALSEELDSTASLATLAGLREAGAHADRPHRRHPELLPDARFASASWRPSTAISRACCAAAAATRTYATCSSKLSAWPSPKPNSSLSGKPREQGGPSVSRAAPIFQSIDQLIRNISPWRSLCSDFADLATNVA